MDNTLGGNTGGWEAMTAIAEQGWDAIVIGSGIGGLAAALATGCVDARILRWLR